MEKVRSNRIQWKQQETECFRSDHELLQHFEHAAATIDVFADAVDLGLYDQKHLTPECVKKLLSAKGVFFLIIKC